MDQPSTLKLLGSSMQDALSSFGATGGLIKRSMYPEVWDLSHSACAGFLAFQGFR